MDTALFSILAKFVNSDTVAKYTRALCAAGFSALLAWKGAWLMPFLTPEMQTAVTAIIVGFAVGLWGQVAAKVSEPNPTETTKVTIALKEQGMVTAKDAAKVAADPTIVNTKPAGEP